ANHVLNIEYDHLDDAAECILFDQVGKMILKSRINGNADKNLYQIHLPTLNQGVYFLQIKTPNSIESRKILIKQ
ncbi:MAG: T9SS type A sorting domain-containing protein, partial [Chitinophagaceae bacterium]